MTTGGARLAAIGLVLLSLGVSALLRSGSADAANRVLPILVMGDSYSAGNGAGSYVGAKGCWRSPNNYGGVFGRALEASPYDVPTVVETIACSGDTTQAFFSATHGRRPQLASVNKGYGLIFLTIGGDDVDFAGIVKNCLIGAFVEPVRCGSLLDQAAHMLRDGSIEARVQGVLSGIRGRASSEATIVLLGYPYLESDLGYELNKGTRHFVAVGRRLKGIEDAGEVIQQRVVRELNDRDHTHSFVFVSTKRLFAGHELSATSSNLSRWFVEPLTDSTLASIPTWYHPNPTGWAEEARLLLSDAAVPKANPIVPPAPCSAALLFEAAAAREGFSPTEGYPEGSPPGASEVGCSDGWAVALISRPTVGTTDGYTLFRAPGPRWGEDTTLGGSEAACQMEKAGVPSHTALILAHGRVHSGIAGC